MRRCWFPLWQVRNRTTGTVHVRRVDSEWPPAWPLCGIGGNVDTYASWIPLDGPRCKICLKLLRSNVADLTEWVDQWEQQG